MEPVINPHDRFFKQVMSNPATARDFVQNYLPADVVEHMELASLELSAESFVDAALQAHHTDLLFTLKLCDGNDGLIYLLFEHKSYADRLVAFQLLRYLVRVWEHSLRQYDRLIPIIPVVVYHGEFDWQIKPGFRWLVQAPDAFLRYVPEFEYSLCDLTGLDDAEIRGEIMLRVTLQVLKHILHNDFGPRLAEALSLFGTLSRQHTGLEYLETLLRYVSASARHITPEEMRKAVDQAFPEGDELMATIAEQWVEQGMKQGLQQGMQQGMQQGLEQGRREGILAAIEFGLELKFGFEGTLLLPEIYKIKDLDVLRAVQQAVKTAESLDQVHAAMQSLLR
jgi:predicted transposase/invertase (TIGR01784 family)